QTGVTAVWVTLSAAVGYPAIIAVVTALALIVDERIGRRHGEEVADAGVVVDRKCIAAQCAAIDLEIPPPAREVVFPRIAREQHANTTVRINTEDRDIGVLIDSEIQPDAFAAGINGGVASVRPQLDLGAGQI